MGCFKVLSETKYIYFLIQVGLSPFFFFKKKELHFSVNKKVLFCNWFRRKILILNLAQGSSSKSLCAGGDKDFDPKFRF